VSAPYSVSHMRTMHTGTHNSVLSFILHVIHEISNNSAEKDIPGNVLRSVMIFKFGQVGSPSRRCGCFWLMFCSYLLVAARQLLMGWTSVQRQKTIPGKSWLKCTSLQFKLHSQTILVSQTQGYKIKWHISVSISSLSLSLPPPLSFCPRPHRSLFAIPIYHLVP
jgi:hypothetical protein